jgi:electron transport complex protein RnfB
MAILILTILALTFGILLGYAAIRFRVEGEPIVEQIDEILPQTQCGQCGYPGCRPYAQAIAGGEADINQCPPGGEAGMLALADLLQRDPKPLAEEGDRQDAGLRMVAVINEETCIGCTKCIQACPVDAISGAARHKHTVLNNYCTGCELCLPPICPVEDCIVMAAVSPSLDKWRWSYPQPQQGQAA